MKTAEKQFVESLRRISLGYQGENGAREIVFDMNSWAETYGPGDIKLLHRRPGDEVPYPAVIHREENLVSWSPTSADTAYSGLGELQLLYFVGDVLAKSTCCETCILHSLMAPVAPPEPLQDLVVQVTEQAVQAESSASSAAASARVSQTAEQESRNAAKRAEQAAARSGLPAFTDKDLGKALVLGEAGKPSWGSINTKSISGLDTILQIENASGGINAIDDRTVKGLVFTREILREMASDGQRRWTFPIQPVFDITQSGEYVTQIWLTDGLKMSEWQGFAVQYLDAGGKQITWYGLGGKTSPQWPITGAGSLSVTLGGNYGPESSYYDDLIGKTVLGITFTTSENADQYHPFACGTESARLKKIEGALATLENGNVLSPAAQGFIDRYNTALFSAGKKTHQILFFTDPHCWPLSSPKIQADVYAALKEAAAVFRNSSFENAVCAGDWICWGKDLSLQTALTEESLTHGIMRNLFKQYHLAIGNHENAFYENRPVLSADQIRNAMVPEYPELYHSYETACFKVIVLNTAWGTGIPIDSDQQNWLQKQLQNADKDIIIVCHIVYEGASAAVAFVTEEYKSILKILDAYNRRVVPFQGAKCKVLCTLAGHMHEYMTHTSETGIIAICGDKLVHNGTSHYYGVIVDSSKHKLTLVQSAGETLVYDLPQ